MSAIETKTIGGICLLRASSRSYGDDTVGVSRRRSRSYLHDLEFQGFTPW
jgi:hypothetical protein